MAEYQSPGRQPFPWVTIAILTCVVGAIENLSRMRKIYYTLTLLMDGNLDIQTIAIP